MSIPVTIMVDASWCPETKVAGYGYWLASSRRKIGGSGQLRKQVSQANVAEAMAIVNSIATALREGVALSGDVLLIRTDCQSAIQLLGKYRRRSQKEDDAIVNEFDRLVFKYNLRVIFKHIKGHTGATERASISNHVCDVRAKDEMRKARASFKLNQIREKVGL